MDGSNFTVRVICSSRFSERKVLLMTNTLGKRL